MQNTRRKRDETTDIYCPICGGHAEQETTGHDEGGVQHTTVITYCDECGAVTQKDYFSDIEDERDCPFCSQTRNHIHLIFD
jgi:hypothetical protein